MNVGHGVVVVVNVEQQSEVVRQSRKSKLVLWLRVCQKNPHELEMGMLERKSDSHDLCGPHRQV